MDRIQILLGSDGSVDGTDDIASKFSDKGVRLFSFRPRRGKMATVNRLVRNAGGDICVFSDISELFDESALRQLIKHFADLDVGAVTGNHVYNNQDSGIGKGTAFYWRFQRFLQQIESRICTVFACDGTIYACRRELFPYPPDDMINDDVAVPLGIISQGKRVVFEPRAIARGEVLSDTRHFFRQKIRGQAGKYQNFMFAPKRFLPFPLKYWFVYVSHSVLPVVVPWFLGVLLLSNIILYFGGKIFYCFLMFGQMGFYILAIVGLVAELRKWRLPFVSIPYYFLIANIGSLCGFFAFISGKQKVTWRKVE